VRKLLTVVAVLAVLLVAADRIGVLVASHVVASKLRTSAMLQADPTVKVEGFPFLTQAVRGRYDRIDLSTGSLTRGGVRLDRLEVSLTGLRLTASQALSGDVSSVPVEGLTAHAVVTYADIASVGRLAGLSVTPVGSHLRVTARLTVLGQSVTASTDSTVRLVGRSAVISAQDLTVAGQSSAALNSALAGRLDLTVPLGTLPYGLALTGVHVSSAGLVLDARSGPTVLSVRALG
jgi:hypothetical protein